MSTNKPSWGGWRTREENNRGIKETESTMGVLKHTYEVFTKDGFEENIKKTMTIGERDRSSYPELVVPLVT